MKPNRDPMVTSLPDVYNAGVGDGVSLVHDATTARLTIAAEYLHGLTIGLSVHGPLPADLATSLNTARDALGSLNRLLTNQPVQPQPLAHAA